MKKNLKKVLSLVLTFAMVFAMSATAFAEEVNECTITVNGTANSEYSAYKLLDVTVSGEHYSYTENSKYSEILSNVLTALGVTIDSEDEDPAATYLSQWSGSGQNNSSEVRAFADAVYKAILADETITADYTTTNSVMTVEYGYYLIVETTLGSTTDTYSLVMLDTAADSTAEIDTKEAVPTLVKKVIDTNDSTGVTSDWQDSADADIGDHVQFQLTGTVSNYYDSYASYYYAFHDKMDDGLTLDADSIVVTIDGVEVDSSSYTVKNNQNTDTSDDCLDDDCDFEVVFTNLKVGITDTEGNAITVKSTSKVVVTYTAELNEDAVYGSAGNLNYARLVYNNNPYYAGSGSSSGDEGDDEGGSSQDEGGSSQDEGGSSQDEGGSSQEEEGSSQEEEGSSQEEEGSSQDEGGSSQDEGGSSQEEEGSSQDEDGSEEEDKPEDHTGETPWDQVVVLTYMLNVNKIIADSTTPLEGATFTLEKYILSSDGTTGEWVEIAQDDSSTASVFVYKGLDDGEYRITETEAPAGYNKLTAPIYFTVTADHDVLFDSWVDEGQGEATLTSTSSDTPLENAETGAIEVTLTTNMATGSLSVDVENSTGTILPTTGGIGTTIFYIVGAILVIGAAVVLVTRRRVSR